MQRIAVRVDIVRPGKGDGVGDREPVRHGKQGGAVRHRDGSCSERELVADANRAAEQADRTGELVGAREAQRAGSLLDEAAGAGDHTRKGPVGGLGDVERIAAKIDCAGGRTRERADLNGAVIDACDVEGAAVHRDRAGARQAARRGEKKRAGVDDRPARVGIACQQGQGTGAGLRKRAGAIDGITEIDVVAVIENQRTIVRDRSDDRAGVAASADLQRRAGMDRCRAPVDILAGKHERSAEDIDVARARNHAGIGAIAVDAQGRTAQVHVAAVGAATRKPANGLVIVIQIKERRRVVVHLDGGGRREGIDAPGKQGRVGDDCGAVIGAVAACERHAAAAGPVEEGQAASARQIAEKDGCVAIGIHPVSGHGADLEVASNCRVAGNDEQGATLEITPERDAEIRGGHVWSGRVDRQKSLATVHAIHGGGKNELGLPVAIQIVAHIGVAGTDGAGEKHRRADLVEFEDECLGLAGSILGVAVDFDVTHAGIVGHTGIGEGRASVGPCVIGRIAARPRRDAPGRGEHHRVPDMPGIAHRGRGRHVHRQDREGRPVEADGPADLAGRRAANDIVIIADPGRRREVVVDDFIGARGGVQQGQTQGGDAGAGKPGGSRQCAGTQALVRQRFKINIQHADRPKIGSRQTAG